ncbi:MAG: FAD-dependent monooxygenase, partial [Xanthomonadales bacterium]|nr:FAD-dependent monooxygenase [Xanthomonadales bacterium]
MRVDADVVVAGAGPVGLAQALALQQAGLRVAVVAERWPEAWTHPAQVGLRVLALAPGPVALLRQIGVWESVAQTRAEPVLAMDVASGHGDFDLHFLASQAGVPALAWIVEMDLLADRLATAWRQAGGASYVDTAIAARELTDDGVILRLDNGERLRTRLLLAADGAGSALRQSAGIDCEQRDYAQAGVVATVQTAEAPAGRALQRFLPGGPLALLPLAGRSCSIVWSQPRARAEHLAGLPTGDFLAELNVAAEGWHGGVVDSGPRAAFPLRLQLARRYTDQRLALLGDAAHQVHPLAGQGLNLGLADVAVLT